MNETKIMAFKDKLGEVPLHASNFHVPIKAEKIMHLLELARCAPTAARTSTPWSVHMLSDEQREQIIAALHRQIESVVPISRCQKNLYDFKAFPDEWRSAWLATRLLHEQKYDFADNVHPDKGRLLKWYRSCLQFLDEPAHILLSLDANVPGHVLIEHATYVKSIRWAGELNGLRVTTFGLTPLNDIIRAIVGLDQSSQLVCGAAIGRL